MNRTWNTCKYYCNTQKMYINQMIIIIFFLIYYSQLAGTIVTYEIVLVQLNNMNTVGSNTSANMTENCHHWNAFTSVMFTLKFTSVTRGNHENYRYVMLMVKSTSYLTSGHFQFVVTERDVWFLPLFCSLSIFLEKQYWDTSMSNTNTYLPLVFLTINCTEAMNLLILGDYAGTRVQKNIHCNLSNCNFRLSLWIIIVSHFYCSTNALKYIRLRV